ncbi:MAG: trypsin-like peptidase domain-containing protein [Patescibacteria group bacterium]|nr:trypsin-like peptidase domain-containing protein [Patescibacteria group bacterium]MDD5715698.1 trypsin-like peptidase domain-containing protein [Patescibacteria group bacterium]
MAILSKKSANPSSVLSEQSPGSRGMPAHAGPVQSVPRIIIGVVIVSILISGLSGAVFAAWMATDQDAAAWVRENVFGSEESANSSVKAAAQSVLAGDIKSITVQENSATIDVVKKASPAVVSIVISQDLSKIYGMTGSGQFPFNIFGTPSDQQESQGMQQVGAGTGFIVSADGMILTNKHVVSTEGAEYTVVMNDQTEYTATVIDEDPFNDIALIKIDANNLPVVQLGDSDALQIGQTVIAIGNSLGQYQNTVTRGVVSGLSRTINASDGQGSAETLEDIIQTDASINSGNSGGPLLNLDGQVIGINTAISREGQLIGFAIPINQAKKAIASVEEFGKIVRPYLGVRYIIINEEIAKQNNLSVNYGALIVRGDSVGELAIVSGSPADKAGLVENDIILEIDGQRIDDDHSLAGELQKYDPGDVVSLKIMHDGEEKSIQATLEEAAG